MNKQRILVVEDNAVALRSLQKYLAAVFPSIEVSSARNGREAIDQAAKLSPDLVIMDMVMPRMDGAKAAQEIKARWPKIKVVLLLLDPKQGQLALESGADAYLLKTDDSSDLLSLLEEEMGAEHECNA